MSEVYETLRSLHDAAWDMIAEGARSRTAPAHLVGLATTGTDGTPQLRNLLLRGAAPGPGEVEMLTDLASGKIAELAADPHAALLAWDAERALQLRLSLVVGIESGKALDAAWDAVPQRARENYGGTPHPGTPLAAPGDYLPGTDRGRFARLRGRVMRMDVLHLGEARHVRATFSRLDDFAGAWCAP
ncbi:pyridoxamine 5'-phosphate oxidase family protein [Profundibacterium mesophilum]|uniref:Pyridoxinepyridoxamine 5'-phosphate oxidase n=1 Tax=Profundibacterium mesophilum KAUST100406-0324 TaxID=1037889 RepID=A0A921P1N1_9RHOB|nr:pyridoxamine 5'-phosphate oxidase family protein [Profundibacterium mesophilum]KAF0677573.1 Pyridoxinepyridoxamine 5'-phosphate oxidase [Profundibacterium mesophilum KAUST100406-0324]